VVHVVNQRSGGAPGAPPVESTLSRRESP
jgi:hypothetical protein